MNGAKRGYYQVPDKTLATKIEDRMRFSFSGPGHKSGRC